MDFAPIILGVVFGVLGALLLAGIIAFLIIRKRRNTKKVTDNNDEKIAIPLDTVSSIQQPVQVEVQVEKPTESQVEQETTSEQLAQ